MTLPSKTARFKNGLLVSDYPMYGKCVPAGCCVICGKELDDERLKVCSGWCWSKAECRGIDIEHPCLACGELTWNWMYCSRQCSASSAFRGKRHSPEWIEAQSQRMQGEKNHFFGKKHTPKSIRKMAIAARNQSKKSRQIRSEKRIAYFKTPEGKVTLAKWTHAGQVAQGGPSKGEYALKVILDTLDSGWVHNSALLKPAWIGGKEPDFVKSPNKVIELFGDYWHGLGWTGKTPEQNERERIEFFNRYGCPCLVVWEHELSPENECRLTQKIRDFDGVLT